MRVPLDRRTLALVLALIAWATLFLRQYLQVAWLDGVPPVVPAASALLSLVLLLPVKWPPRTKVPILTACVLTAAAGCLLLGVREENSSLQNEWRRNESKEITLVLDAVWERIEDLLDVSTSIGDKTGAFVRESRHAVGVDSIGVRLDAFQSLGALSEQIKKGELLPTGTEFGIQLFDGRGHRTAWAGWPQYLDTQDHEFIASDRELIYSRQVSLYRILTHIIPVFGDETSAPTGNREKLATVVVDMPLEVNYKVNNKFLKSASLADNLVRGAAANIRFDYSPVAHNLPDIVASTERRPASVKPFEEISGNETIGLSRRTEVRSPLGNTLVTVTVYGRPFHHYLETRNDRFLLAANLFILLALLVYFVVSLRHFPDKFSGPLHSVKALYLVAGIAFIRYSLLWFQPSVPRSQVKIFEPAIFATPILGGLMRSAGDLLITSVFFVAALYGVLKISREAGEVREDAAARRTGLLSAFKGLLAAVASVGVFELTRRFIGSVVMNANPRLIGETVKIFQPEVVILHLSAFLMVAGIFLAGMIVVWGVYRLRGGAGAGKTLVGAAVIVAVSLALSRWDLAAIALLVLLFIVFAPRIVQREDLVSIVIVAFSFVIIVSAAAYVSFNEEYQRMRRSFIQEKVAEVTHPSDNWKVFILEDILESFSRETTIREALSNPVSSNVQRLAFDLWAQSQLSLLGYSCAIHVFDEADSMVSRFAVEMPYRVRSDEVHERLETPSSQEWIVLDLTTETPQGPVRFYRGIVNLEDYVMSDGDLSAKMPVGKVVVDIPFFFESLSWAARTGPQTPEVLRNIQEGDIAPRLVETETILLAGLKGNRVLESSTDVLPAGYTFERGVLDKAFEFEWPLLKTNGSTYRFLAQGTEEPQHVLVAGFRVPSPSQHVLRWSTILSLYFFFTVALIILIIVLKEFPLLKAVLPTLTPGRRLGFQQKLLGSFLIVALLPAVILGVFSVRMIKDRFVQESRKEALYKAFNANKALSNVVIGELHALMDHYDVEALIRGEPPPFLAYDDRRLMEVLRQPGAPVVDNGTDAGRALEALTLPFVSAGLPDLMDRVSPERVFVHFVEGRPYLGVTSHPFTMVSDGGKETCVVYFARLIDAELLGEIADQVGADVNLFEGGELIATSREGLLSGGFISSMMNAGAFVNVSVMGVDHALATEKAGRYRYQVAYVPVPSIDRAGDAAIGLPLLFRPESYSVEVEKATSVVLSLFALLSAATIGLGLLLARGIFEPLKGLLEGTKRIGRGDFSFKLPSTRRDEIGTVVEAFNEMTNQVSHSQAQLEERRKYLEVILVNIGTGVISTDADDRIRAVNSAAERILGVRSGDLVGKTADELAGEDVLPSFFRRIEGGAPPEAPFLSSEADVVKDGHKRTIKYMRTGLCTDGRYMGTVFVFEDLTELINSKKLSAWVEMARQIAHEIKNPLTPIKLSTQFMVRAHAEKSDDFDRILRESSNTIMQQVDVLRNIASEFSSFGRLQQLDLSVHRIVPLISEIVLPYRRNTSGVNVMLSAPDRDLRVIVDPEAIRKICTNLIENAMEAMPGGGELAISCDKTTWDEEDVVSVSFNDTGAGLSDEARDRLFEPYFSTKTTGTGLGLAICRSLSREMGGDVTVENLPNGSGVEATLYLKPA